MKKLKLTVAFLLALIGFGASAQEKKTVKFGVKAGYALSIYSTDNVKADDKSPLSDKVFDDLSLGHGFYAGLYTKIPLGDGFSLQPEVIYENQKTKKVMLKDLQVGPHKDISVDYRIERHNLKVPVLLNYEIMDGLSVGAGPFASVSVDQKSSYKNVKLGGRETPKAAQKHVDQEMEEFYAKEKLDEMFKTFQYGLAFGLGYELPKLGLNVNARYDLGLNDISKNSKLIKVKTHSFLVGLGYSF